MFEEKRADFPGYEAEVVPALLPGEVLVALQEMASGDAYVQEREDVDLIRMEFSNTLSELLT